MTPEQFVFWLRGYLASGDIGNFTRGDAKAIAEELAKVVPPAPPPKTAQAPISALREWEEEIMRRKESHPCQSPPQPQPQRDRPTTGSPHPFRPVEITCGLAAEVRNAS